LRGRLRSRGTGPGLGALGAHLANMVAQGDGIKERVENSGRCPHLSAPHYASETNHPANPGADQSGPTESATFAPASKLGQDLDRGGAGLGTAFALHVVEFVFAAFGLAIPANIGANLGQVLEAFGVLGGEPVHGHADG
jgi:hypothetical protein